MAKKSQKKVERREKVEQLRKDQARKERVRSGLILGVCIAIVIGLLTAALIPYLKDKQANDAARKAPIGDLGVSRAAAGCEPIKAKSAKGSGQHEPIGTRINYPDAPPAFGPHWANFLQGPELRNFFSPTDRPELERVVHSLEHGHTLLWYDDTVKPGSKAYTAIEAMAGKFAPQAKFMAVPWLSTDGAAFPDGMHVALTHWTGPDKQTGVWEYCAKPSGDVVKDFTAKYLPTNSPEPNAP